MLQCYTWREPTLSLWACTNPLSLQLFSSHRGHLGAQQEQHICPQLDLTAQQSSTTTYRRTNAQHEMELQSFPTWSESVSGLKKNNWEARGGFSKKRGCNGKGKAREAEGEHAGRRTHMEGKVHPFLPVHTHLLVFDTGFLWDPGTAQLPGHMESEDRDSSAPQGTGRNFSSLAENTAAYVGTNPSVCVLKAGSESNPCKSSNTALW